MTQAEKDTASLAIIDDKLNGANIELNSAAITAVAQLRVIIAAEADPE